MTRDDLLRLIESDNVFYDGIVSSTSTALRIRYGDNSDLATVVQALQQDASLVPEAIERFRELMTSPVEAGYNNPSDLYICAYLYIFSVKGLEDPYVCRDLLGARRTDLHFSTALANHLLKLSEKKSSLWNDLRMSVPANVSYVAAEHPLIAMPKELVLA